MSLQKETPERGAPAGRFVIVLTVILIVGLIFLLSTRGLFNQLTLKPPAVAGEWQAYREPWRLAFSEDKSVVSSTGPSPEDESQAWTSVPGTYSVDFFGTLWIALDNGKAYSATLQPDMPNRFDLIDSGTEAVTVFERTTPANPPPAP
jgi:hypothetical protein